MTETERAYIAGILDGEGHMSIQYQLYGPNKPGGHYKAVMAITGTHRGMLEWVQERVGGKIYAKSQGTEDGRQKPHYQLVINRKEWFLAMLDAVEPYLIIKKRHAAVMRRFLARQLYTHHCPIAKECYDELKRLNIRGITKHQLTLL